MSAANYINRGWGGYKNSLGREGWYKVCGLFPEVFDNYIW